MPLRLPIRKCGARRAYLSSASASKMDAGSYSEQPFCGLVRVPDVRGRAIELG